MKRIAFLSLLLALSAVAAPQSVANTIADLRAQPVTQLPPAVGAIKVLGSAKKGDGGDGSFYYDVNSTATDDGYSVIKPASIVVANPGRWLRVPDRVIDIRTFGGVAGAIGSAATNDAAFVSAIAYAKTMGGAKIIVPAGIWYISATIKMTQCIGTSVEGSQRNWTFDGFGTKTDIVWAGPANGTMIQIMSGNFCAIKGLRFNGNSTAGIGIENTSQASTLGTRGTLVEDVFVIHIRGTPGQCIHNGSVTNYQNDTSTFRRFYLSDCVTGIYQDGQQTVENTYEGPSYMDGTSIGADFHDGDVIFSDTDSEGFVVADFRIQCGAYWATFRNNYVEATNTGETVFLFPNCTTRNYPTTFIGNRVLFNEGATPTGKIIDFQQTGAVVATGNTWQVFDVATEHGIVSWNSPSGGTPGRVTEIGDVYVNHAFAQVNNQMFYTGIGVTNPLDYSHAVTVSAFTVASTDYASGIITTGTVPFPSPNLPGSEDATYSRANLNLFESPLYFREGNGGREIHERLVFNVLNRYNGSTILDGMDTNGKHYLQGTQATIAGNYTISKPSGIVTIAAGATSITITNTLCAATSAVRVQLLSADASMTSAVAVPGAGSFVITGNKAAGAGVGIYFEVIELTQLFLPERERRTA